MRNARTLFFVTLTFGALAIVSGPACSSTGARPDAGAFTDEAGPPTVSPVDAALLDSGADAADADDSGLPATCRNTIKDANESDVDCGGECSKCVDGKACGGNDDCAGGQCFNAVCTSPQCTDGLTSPGESDVDCGGPICRKCTIGRKCAIGTDCESGACTNGACACPPYTTIVSRAGGGGAYCVSKTEITKGQYNKFLTANQPVSQQSATCVAVNTTFVPRAAWPPAQVPGPLAFNMGLPVHYVDWCDAFAYCKWQGMHLCGKVGGGGITTAERNDATLSAWYNACSAQGTKTFPYGDNFDQTKCNGDGFGFPPNADALTCADAGGATCPGIFGHPSNEDDRMHRVVGSDDIGNVGEPDQKGCQGGAVDLFGMSGNLAEWEDACDGTNKCAVRGGSYAAGNTPATLACNADRLVDRMPTDKNELKDIGFRCCLY